MRDFNQLPEDWQSLSLDLTAHIRNQIKQAGGWISFADYMQLALYSPGLGYYANALKKIGAQGDFITAPEVSPLFSQCLANQAAQILKVLPEGEILEIGAGRGTMAIDLLRHLAQAHKLQPNYFILEPSASLQAVQKAQFEARAPELLSQVHWIDQLPQDFRGVMLANEVLDAMPVHRYCVTEASVEERGVCWHEASQAFHWQAKPLNPEEMSARPFIAQAQAQISPLTPSYCFEWNHLADGWVHSLADSLTQGAILLIDYGQEGRSYFHPSRTDGQLACYFQHTKDERPLEWPGLKDITSHVNFSQISQAGDAAGLILSGFTTQANFLIGNGLGELCMHMPEETIDRFKLAQAIKKLTMPDEMGEDFKVIAFTKDLTIGLAGFQSKDLRHWL